MPAMLMCIICTVNGGMYSMLENIHLLLGDQGKQISNKSSSSSEMNVNVDGIFQACHNNFSSGMFSALIVQIFVLMLGQPVHQCKYALYVNLKWSC